MIESIQIKGRKFNKFISDSEIQKQVALLAQKINKDYADKEPIFIIVLNGAFIFASDLIKQFNNHCSIEFVKLSSYSSTKSTGSIKEVLGLDIDIDGKDLIIVEDIIDTGLTLEYFISKLYKYKPNSIKIVTLLVKPDSFGSKYPVDYHGFTIPNDFIVGYGLDLDGYGRNFPNIYKIEE